MALPPSLSGQPPMGASPMAVPTGNPGLAANALVQVREAVRLLEMALPQMPPGTDVHKSVLNAISSVSKHIPASGEVAGVQQTALRDLAQSSQQNAMLTNLMRSMGGGQDAGPGGGGPGAPPMPGGGDLAAGGPM